ncbi:ankyrin repeat domain-containing protein 26-like isoform X4 [Lineus longissimus]|uniref:ankyrin repeat domain-containing protein 26-like isoform X4 n=1 Tax=Lineus longissimus TaxID=88925 RepID=UPI00315D4298
MKKFLKIGKSKKSNASDTASVGSAAGGSSITVGYDLREKDLPKLHKAAWTGDLSKVKQLAKKDASPLDKENRTPLHLSCSRGHTAIVEELISWKAKLNKGDNSSRTPLMKAVECHHLECAKLLLEAKAEVNNCDREGNTSLHYAVQDGELEIARLLIDFNGNPDARNKLGYTPLHVATIQKYYDVCQLLLNSDADIDITDENKRTPLMHACHAGSVTLVKLFLSYHADVLKKDIKGWSAEDCAAIEGHHSCSQLIQEQTSGSRGRSSVQSSPEITPESSPELHRKPIGGFGAPAADADISEVDASLSIASPRLDHLDSWDSEEESLGLGLKKEPVKVSLAKFVKGSDTEDSMHTSTKESPRSRIPKRVDSDKQKKVEFTESRQGPSENGTSKIPKFGKKQSQDSVQSDSWNDDESSLGLGVPAGQAKKPLFRQEQMSQDDTDVESDDDDLPIMRTIQMHGPKAPPRHAKDSRILNSESASDKQKKKESDRDTKRKVMEELGLSDVSDVSDPEDLTLSSPRKKAQNNSDWDDTAADTIPKITPRGDRPQSALSDWDTTAEEMTPRTPRQRTESVKSEGSEWDSVDGDEPPITPAHPLVQQPVITKAKPVAKKQIVEIGSDDDGGLSPIAEESYRKSFDSSAWDSTVVENPVVQAPSPPSEPKEVPPSPTKPKEAPPPLPERKEAPPPPQRQESANSDWDSTEAESPRGKASVNLSGLLKKPSEDEESAWDSDDGVGVLPTDQTAAKPFDKIKKAINESEEETEETISEWEVERRKQKERKQREEEESKVRAADIVRLAEERERQEREERERKHREQEEAERQKREREEEERRRKEEAEKQAAEERKQREIELQWQKVEKDRENREKEAEEMKCLQESLAKEKKEFEAEVQRKLDHQMRDIITKEEAPTVEAVNRSHLYSSNSFDHEGIEGGSGNFEDDHGNLNGGHDERSRQIKARREKAEKELEDARLRHLGRSMSHPSLDGSLEDEDTYTSDVVPDSPRDHHINKDRDLTSPLGSYVHGVLGSSTPIPNNYNINGDDGLSYTSTENEDSIHMNYRPTTPRTPDIMNTSLNLNDSTSILRMQEQLREHKRLLEKEKSARVTVDHKKKLLEKERVDLQKKIEDMAQARSNLEQNKVELESKLRSLDYNLNEEIEKRKNAEVLLQKTKQQLSRKEEQYTQELDAKQKTELGMRNLQMELRSKESLIKQLEDEKNEAIRSLAQEKHARALQEQHNEKQVEMQQSINLEAVRQTGKQAAAFDKLEEADENMRSVREAADKLKTELYGTKLELDRLKSRTKDDQRLLTTENEELTTRIEDLKHDIKLNEEALAHASMQYTTQLNSLKTENSLLSSSLDKERVAKDKLDSELESLRTRYNHASNELERAQMARTELERNIQREREEWNRSMDRKDQEMNALKDTNQSLYQRVGIAETKLGAVENELSVANTSLLERTAILTNLQREVDQRRSSHDNQEYALRKEKEDNAKLQARLDSTLEKMSTAQHECLSMKQELDTYRNSSSLKDRAAMDSQDKFAELLGTIRTDYDKTRITLEEKNNHLVEQVERYKEELRNAEMKRTSLEQELRQLQHQHNEMVKRLAVAEVGLENAKQAKVSIDAEKVKLRQDVEQFQGKLESAHSRTQDYQARITELVDRLEHTEKDTQKQHAQMYESVAVASMAQKNRGDLEDLVHKLEIENAKLESSLKHEMERVEMLQRDLQDSNKVRDTLESVVTNLRGTNVTLEDKLHEETAHRSMFAQEAEDSRGLWETEVKSRSKLGLRDEENNEFHPVDETDGGPMGDDQDIAQLERTKQESVAIADEEKRRARKAAELKKVAETKMEALQEKNTDLQKEVATLKAHLKAAKKRLRELDSGESRINTLHSEFDRERLMMDGTLSTVRRQSGKEVRWMDDVHSQLQQEIDKKEQLESKNRALQQELHSHKTVERAYQKLEKAKRKLDEEFAQYKMPVAKDPLLPVVVSLAHVKAHFVERADLERVRQEYEVKARMEVNHKLEEVNAYLEEQAQAREKLDHIRSSNENQLRTEFDRKQKELQEELTKLRAGYQDVVMQKTTKDSEVQKLKDMYDNEQKLREKLTNRLFKANDAAVNTKAMLSLERQRMRASNPALFNSSVETNGFLSSPVGAGKTTPNFGMNNSDGLSHKIRNELNRSIAKHLEASTMKDVNLPSRTVDDSYLTSSPNKSGSDYLSLLRRNYLL